VHQALADRGHSLNIVDGVQTVDLNGDWSCSVAPPSSHLPLYEARETTCRAGDKSVQFSVQCEPRRPKDRAQIRFRAVDGRFLDFIEVGCELQE
jgi:hypothetical protein